MEQARLDEQREIVAGDRRAVRLAERQADRIIINEDKVLNEIAKLAFVQVDDLPDARLSLRLRAKLDALDKLARYLRLLDGPDTTNILIQVSSLSPEARQERIEELLAKRALPEAEDTALLPGVDTPLVPISR